MSDSGSRRRQVMSFILSGIFPGLGQLYNREYLKAALFIIPGAVLTWLVSLALPPSPDVLALRQQIASLILLLVALFAVWIWAIIDAWKVAGR
jgi:hypothetical protein